MACRVLRPDGTEAGLLSPEGAGDTHHEKSTRPVALVTGGAIRVGKAIALQLAASGHDVAITYHGSAKEADTTVSELTALGVHAEGFQIDFNDMAATQALPARVAERMSRLDVLVNSASVFYRTPVGGVVEEEWDDLFMLNAKAPFFLTQAAVPYLKYEDPCIINILDVSTERPFPGYVPYVASKAALQAVTLGLSKALAPKVRVNAVAPGPVLPPDDYDEEEKERTARTTLLGRWGSPEDVAAAVAFLVSNRYLTGVVLPVDGGRRLA
jgi:pteridine reductase